MRIISVRIRPPHHCHHRLVNITQTTADAVFAVISINVHTIFLCAVYLDKFCVPTYTCTTILC